MENQLERPVSVLEIDVNRSSDAIPTYKPIIPLALNVGEIIADVLEIEPDSSLEQIRPKTTPVS